MDKVPDSATIMLIPDNAYKAARPRTKDHHLTVAHFGRASELTPSGIARLRDTVSTLARFAGGPIDALANGIGAFNAGRDGIAVVDLIDGIGTFRVRSRIENLFGDARMGYSLDNVRVNYKHGFTPHITREYLDREDDFYGEITPDLIDDFEFKFIAVGLWHGDQRYEVSL